MVLGELAHVADDAHGDFFVECFLDVLRQADAFNGEVFQREAEFGKLGREQAGQLLRQQDLVGGHVEEGDAGSAEGGGKPGNGEVAQLLFELCAGVAFHNAADFFKEFFRVGDAVAVHAEGAQLYRAEFGIAHGNGLRRAPFAAELLFGVEEVNVGFERGLEEFVPVFQVGQDGQGLCVERVAAGGEYVGGFAFVHKHRHLRLAHGQAGAVLDFLVGNGKTPYQGFLVGIFPLDDVDELLLDKVEHGGVLSLRQTGGVEQADGYGNRAEQGTDGDIVARQFFGCLRNQAGGGEVHQNLQHGCGRAP